jgi:hypothetical protein
VITSDAIEIKFPLGRARSVDSYHNSTARRKWYVHEARSTKGFEGNVVEPVLWPSPKGGLGKYSLDNLQALYGPHLVTGNTLVELRLGGQYCKHPVYPYDGCYVFCISPISSGTVMFPVVGARSIFDPLTMTEPKYPMEERYAPIYSHLCHPNTIYINTCLVPYDGGYWHIHKKTDDDEKVTWAPNYSRFVSFSMVSSQVNAESVYMFGSDCFVVTATRDINVDDRIVLYGAATNGYVVESRGSLSKL